MLSASRRGSLIVVFTVLAAAIAGALGYGLVTQPRVVSLEPSKVTRDSTPRVRIQLSNVGSLTAADVHATIDGRSGANDVSVDGNVVTVQMPRLSDGDHEIRVRTDPLGLLRRTIDERWRFSIDTQAPPLRIERHQATRDLVLDSSDYTLAARTEPGSSLTVSAGSERATATADDEGVAETSLTLVDGRHAVRIVATDAAGNERRLRRFVVVDTEQPVVKLTAGAVLKSSRLSVTLRIADTTAVKVKATIDGRGAHVSGSGSGSTYTLTDATRMSEGTHALKVTVTDSAGNTATLDQPVLVDSSERLGENTMKRGARGNDVRQLQTRLRDLGIWKPDGSAASKREWSRMLYGGSTMAAVCDFQRQRGLAADCAVGEQTVAALTQRIVINRAAHTLTLYRNDQVVKTYGVAVGSAKYPTPAGSFTIVDMQRNPTWNPPDSDWAKGEKPIPPGPDNPLGTRWMGLSAPAIGVHGTNSPASIGYSVSHGCIRMKIPEVEELFEMVHVGTPVTIV